MATLIVAGAESNSFGYGHLDGSIVGTGGVTIATGAARSGTYDWTPR